MKADLRRVDALRITIALDGSSGFPEAQSIGIERMPCRFGGWRYYFACPRLGRRCEVMPLLDGEFASREAHSVRKNGGVGSPGGTRLWLSACKLQVIIG